MKISDIDAFAAVVRCQTLSQAAAELGMTQPAITRRVQNLEEALGATLLDRNTKPPRPTDIGLQVFEQGRAILREVDALRELTAGQRPPAGEFRVGLTQGLGELMLPGLIARIAGQWPALATQVTTAWGGMLVERVARRELDAALVFLAREMVLPPHVEGERLLAARLVAVGRKGDWPRRSYRLADCRARGWVLNPDGCGFRAGLHRAHQGAARGRGRACACRIGAARGCRRARRGRLTEAGDAGTAVSRLHRPSCGLAHASRRPDAGASREVPPVSAFAVALRAAASRAARPAATAIASSCGVCTRLHGTSQ